MNSRLDKIWFHQAVKFDFTADLTGTVVSCIGLGRVKSKFSTCSGLGWVGLGHTKWTHGQLCGINRTICKQSAPCSRQVTTPAPHHSVFTGRVLFLMPNQQCQSTEGPTTKKLMKTDLFRSYRVHAKRKHSSSRFSC